MLEHRQVVTVSTIIEVRNLTKHYPIREGIFSRRKIVVHAVDDVSFKIDQGEMFGLVGESGCGKTSTSKCILRLIEPTGGIVLWKGENILQLSRRELRKMRLRMQMVFQDPYSSLDPTMSVEDIVGEALVARGLNDEQERREEATKVLERVELSSSYLDRYPHELSGGEKQRVGIARALAVNPEFIVADEPVAALDTSVKGKILNLLMDLKERLRLTFMFVSHDLSMVKHVCNRLGVMYAGELVELGEVREVFGNPRHPYTEALLSAIPIPNPALKRKRIVLEGDVPSLINPPPGCRFHVRCRYAESTCSRDRSKLVEVAKGHFVACHLRENTPHRKTG